MTTRVTNFGTTAFKIDPADLQRLSKLTLSLLRLYRVRLDDDGYLLHDLSNNLIADITRELSSES